MKYYNQNNYANVKYPSSANKNATVKTSGCGVCCICMIVENLTGKGLTPAQGASFAIKVGARASTGTDMVKLSKKAAETYGLTVKHTSDEAELIKHLQAGGMAIGNVGGNYSGHVGVFSDGGHYVVVAGYRNNKLVVLDPGYYNGKYNKAGRKGLVTVSGNECYCSVATLNADTKTRTPNYYLFAKEGADEVKTTIKVKLPSGTTKNYTGVLSDNTSYTPVRALLEDLGYKVGYENGVVVVSK